VTPADFFAEIAAWIESLFSAPAAQPQSVESVIQEFIVRPLSLSPLATGALYAQAKLETGDFKSRAFLATNSLFNRHAGSGAGYWSGRTFYVSPQDADLRIYTDIGQSARDMAQLLQDPLYARALYALRQGDTSGYFSAVAAAGFSTQSTYAYALQRVYNDSVA
jgi:flagellum-specific peptidoglycan hydrolase FlgJ